MLEHARIGTRIAVGFGVLLLGAGAAFGAAVWLGLASQTKTELAGREMTDRVSQVQRMQIAQLNALTVVRSAALMTNGRSVKQEMLKYDAAIKSLQGEEAAYAARTKDPQAQALLKQSIDLRKSAEPVIAEAIEHVIALSGEEGARVLTAKLTPIQVKWTEQLRLLGERDKVLADDQLKQINREGMNQVLLVAGGLTVTLALGAFFAFRITRSVTTKLQRAVDAARSVAAGDLAVDIQVSGADEASEVLRSLTVMAERLSAMVAEVRDSAGFIHGASAELSAGNLDLSSRTEHQAAVVEETSASLIELVKTVNDSAVHADEAQGLAQRASATAKQAGQSMGKVAETMSKLSASSHRIRDIIGVIDAIAFQTNVLALNAAVEAARAGDHGKGFAVVASEVRSLSQNVVKAADEVRGLIGESVSRIEAGSSQVVGMSTTMKSMVELSEEVKSLLQQIASASSTQQTSLNEVNDAVREVDHMTQKNAALVEQVSAAAQSLEQRTQTLTALVGQFKIREQSARADDLALDDAVRGAEAGRELEVHEI